MADSVGGCSRSAMVVGDAVTTYRWRFPVWHGGFVSRSASASRRWRLRGSALGRRRGGWAATHRRCIASSSGQGARPVAPSLRRPGWREREKAQGLETARRFRVRWRGAPGPETAVATACGLGQLWALGGRVSAEIAFRARRRNSASGEVVATETSRRSPHIRWQLTAPDSTSR